MTESGPIAIGVDVGGSGIKAAAIDTSRGVLVSERVRVPTPEPSTPAAVIASIFRLVKRVEHSMGAAGLPVGVDFPSVILDGKTMTAANVDRQWVQYPAVEHLERAMARPVSLINDADAAGLAEMRFGAGVGHRGVVLVLTLGTGVGSALFVDGVLVPNTELGHMEIRGRDAERRSAAAARVRRGLSWKAWTEDLDEHLMAIDRILWPDLIVLGGGVSKNADRFIPRLTCRPPVVPAVLRNEAGMVGAAMVAVERGGEAASSFALTFGPRSGSGTGEGETGPEPGQAATEGEPETVGESTTEVEPDDTLPDAGPPTVTVADAEVEADEEAEAWAAEIVADAEEVEAADAEEVDVRAQPIDAETTEVEPEPVEADAVEVEPEPVEADAVEVTAEPTDPGPPAEPVVDAEAEPVEEAEVVELPTAADAVIDGEAVERPVADEGSGEEVPPG